MGRERLAFLWLVTGGHTAIHWFQTMFPAVRPRLTQGRALDEIQPGSRQTARQLTAGTMSVPAGIAAASFARQRAAILASALVFMGAGYFCFATTPGLGGALFGA